MKRLINILILFVLPSFIARAQEDYTFIGKVRDSLNNITIPYVKIINKSTGKGTISRNDGTFELKAVTWGDTIQFRSIGFQSTEHIFSPESETDLIYLNPEVKEFRPVTVLANDSYLYQLIHKAAKFKVKNTIEAKTFYQLETYRDSHQLELYQSYNNGYFNGYDVNRIALKAGRFYLATHEGRTFSSMETTRAFYLQKLLQKNKYFPTSPFELSNRKLRKYYRLTLASKYTHEKNVIYEINLSPRKDSTRFFGGTVTLDSALAHIYSIQLECKNTASHPFAGLHNAQMRNVRLSVKKEFDYQGGIVYPELISIEYEASYHPPDTSEFSIKSRAILYPYDYQSTFILPLFQIPENSMYVDYKRLEAMPYDADFWRCTQEFTVPNSQIQNEFIQKKARISNQKLLHDYVSFRPNGNQNFYEHPYVIWSPDKRIILKENLDSTLFSAFQTYSTIPASRYELTIQLFLDVNILCDSLQITTACIFDPFESFYSYEMTKNGQAFINMFFDLAEIERQKLHRKLLQGGISLDEIYTLHNESKIALEKVHKRFKSQVDRGTNIEAMKQWNSHIYDELSIDNLQLFSVLE